MHVTKYDGVNAKVNHWLSRAPCFIMIHVQQQWIVLVLRIVNEVPAIHTGNQIIWQEAAHARDVKQWKNGTLLSEYFTTIQSPTIFYVFNKSHTWVRKKRAQHHQKGYEIIKKIKPSYFEKPRPQQLSSSYLPIKYLYLLLFILCNNKRLVMLRIGMRFWNHQNSILKTEEHHNYSIQIIIEYDHG